MPEFAPSKFKFLALASSFNIRKKHSEQNALCVRKFPAYDSTPALFVFYYKLFKFPQII